jgi:hypothetical protein
LQAEAKAAEDACKRAEEAAAAEAAAEAKRQRDIEREAARKALQEVISTVCSPQATSYTMLLPYLKCKQMLDCRWRELLTSTEGATF